MKIVICGSMSSSVEMMDIEKRLSEKGHNVVLPRHTKEYATNVLAKETAHESIQKKINDNLIRDYYDTIENSDAVLLVNIDKNGIKNYIGGNAFLEMGFGYVLNKKVFILNDIPEMIYADEILAMQPIVLLGDLSKIN